MSSTQHTSKRVRSSFVTYSTLLLSLPVPLYQMPFPLFTFCFRGAVPTFLSIENPEFTMFYFTLSFLGADLPGDLYCGRNGVFRIIKRVPQCSHGNDGHYWKQNLPDFANLNNENLCWKKQVLFAKKRPPTFGKHAFIGFQTKQKSAVSVFVFQ